MADLLVRLYALPEAGERLAALAQQGIHVRRPQTGEKHVPFGWVKRHFNETWADGCDAAFANRPISCFIAVETTAPTTSPQYPYDLPPERLVGFACYDVAAKGMFGAMGVHADYRRHGIGAALLLAGLHAMRDAGYAYAVIGWSGSPDFYARAVGATIIAGSEPGIFRGPLVGDALHVLP